MRRVPIHSRGGASFIEGAMPFIEGATSFVEGATPFVVGRTRRVAGDAFQSIEVATSVIKKPLPHS